MKTLRMVLLLASCFSFSLTASAELVSITTGEYSPFSDEKATHGGFVNRVIKEAFARKNIDVAFTYLPWKRALEDAKSGKKDASSFWFEDAGKRKDFIYSEPLSEHRQLLFHQKSTVIPEWNEIKDLKTLKFGATRGYSYTAEFWDAGKNGDLVIDEVTSDSQNFKKLSTGRIDVFIMDEITGWQLLRKELPIAVDKITTHAKPLTTTNGFLLFPRSKAGSEKLAEAFNQGLAEMKADGTYDRFLVDLYKNEF